MSWTDTNWKLVDGVNESLPYNTQLTTIIDGMDTSYTPKVCWIPFTITGDTSGNHYLKYRGSSITDTIDNSNIKFVYYKYGVENYGLPKTIPYNIDIPGAAKGLTHLTSVSIPISVKYIDHYAFWNTGLTEVTIASDCKYQRTSFPPDCVINTIDVIPFTCDSGYYFDYEVEATINGNLRKKSNNIPAIGIIVSFLSGNYCNPIFISTDPEAVNFIANDYENVAASKTVTHDGLTWYYSTQENGVNGNYPDSSGHIPSYPSVVDWDYGSGVRTITQQAVLDILAYVHARRN